MTYHPSAHLVKRAARMKVIPCSHDGLIHVLTPEGRIHHIQSFAIGGATCDCEASSHGRFCAHRLAHQWHNDLAASSAKETA